MAKNDYLEYKAFRRKYPTFPGIKECIQLIKMKNIKGGELDFICDLLGQNLKSHIEEFFTLLGKTSDSRTRLILLGIIERSATPESLPFLKKLISESSSEEEMDYAKSVLRNIDSKEARNLLWETNH